LAPQAKSDKIASVTMNHTKKTQEIVDELIALLGVKASATTEQEGEGENSVIKVTIESEESGLLIGAHGVTLEAIESFISLALRTATGEWVKVIVDIAEWRQKQSESLLTLGKQAASRAKQTGEPQYLYNLSASQRREIHVFLKDEKGVETRSDGEGIDRYLIIEPKKAE
jgi:spoIIIJ-associated protein